MADAVLSRPKFSPAIAIAAAQAITDTLIRDGHLTKSQHQDAVLDISKHARQHMDGYEIAKALDSYESWDCDFQMCEILDGFASECSDVIRRAEKDWAAATCPTPPHPIGTRVRIGTKETGEITGVYEYGAAKFLVKLDADPKGDTSRRVINFEDVAVLEAA